MQTERVTFLTSRDHKAAVDAYLRAATRTPFGEPLRLDKK